MGLLVPCETIKKDQQHIYSADAGDVCRTLENSTADGCWKLAIITTLPFTFVHTVPKSPPNNFASSLSQNLRFRRNW